MGMLVFSLCLLLPSLIPPGTAKPPLKIRYDRHKVVEIHHDTEEQFSKIIDLGHKFQVDWWNLPRHSNETLHVRVHPQKLEDFTAKVTKLGAKLGVFIEDVQSLIDQEPEFTNHHRTRRATFRSSGYDVEKVYYPYNSILAYLRHVSSVSLPDGIKATKINIGHTYEGRQVDLLHISHPSSQTSKKSIFIDGGIHAREWIAPATVIYFIEQLAFNPGQDPVVSRMLDKFDFYLLPVVNPDGYEYSRLHERLWRKNRRFTGSCTGVDLNRNFPFHWNPSIGGSFDPCSEIFSGPRAGSELETQNLVKFLNATHNHPLVAYLTIHSYGQMWLYPWGYTSALPTDFMDLDVIAWFTTKNLEKLYETRYTTGSAKRTLYSAAGGSDDYAKGNAGIKYSYTVELRDTGRYGFALPTSLIKPTVEETFAGLKAFATSVAAHEGW